MLGGLLKQGNQQPAIRDRVIVFNEDDITCEIQAIIEETEDVVRTETKTIPKADLTVRLSKQGRIFVLRAPQMVVQGTEHLRRVEMNTIVRHLTQYKKPEDQEKRMDWFKIAMLIGMVIMGIVAAAN